MDSIKKMTRLEVEHELLRHRSRHYEGPAEAYDFNIKVYNISPPAVLRRVMSAEEAENRLQNGMAARLRDFIDMVQGTFTWVSQAYQTGRSGGWLTVLAKPGYEVFGSDDTITSRMTDARRRLFDVEWIDQKLEREKRNLVRDAAEPDFWEIRKQDWSPRR